MATVSLCMIVKDEEEVLARCLESAKGLADEIVIVDTGSADGTRAIAAEYTDRIFDFPWNDSFADARNYAFSKGTGEYLMWLDADDVIEGEDRERFLRLKESLTGEEDVVMLPYEAAFDGQGRPVFSYYRERLLRNHRGFRWEGAVHEAIAPAGRVVWGDAAVRHRKGREKPGGGDRNLKIYEGLLKAGEKLDARHEFYYARELKDHGRYGEAAKVFSAFLDRPDGWVENRVEACRQLAACFKALGDSDGEMRALLRSFVFDVPRAETLCQLGNAFMEQGKYEAAAYWFLLAPAAPRRDKAGGFVMEDCYGYIPYLQLCVCFDRLGDYGRAAEYNERAAEFKPQSEAVGRNREYFRGRLEK